MSNLKKIFVRKKELKSDSKVMKMEPRSRLKTHSRKWSVTAEFMKD